MAGKDPQIILLETRVDAWFRAVKESRYNDIYKMRVQSGKQSKREKRDLAKLLREANRSIKILTWKIAEIETQGELAEVRTLLKLRIRENGGWVNADDEQVSYWSYQRANWFSLPWKPEAWVEP